MINPITYAKIIYDMMKKNFKNILRSKSSALIILLGPFIIIMLIGLAFNTTGLHNINVGIYAEQTNDVVNEITQSLKDNDFTVKYADSIEACTQMVEGGEVHLCITVDGDLSADNIERKLTFHVDYSKVNLVFSILNVITHEVEDISQDLSMQYTELLIEQMNATASEITEKSVTITALANNAEQMKQSLELLSTQLSGIEVDSSSFGIDNVESQLSQSTEMINDFGEIAEETTSTGIALLQNLESYITTFESELTSQINTIEEFENTIGTYSTLACNFDFGTVEGLEFDPCSELVEIENSLDNAVSQAESVGNQFDDLKSQLDSVRTELEDALGQQQAILDGAASNIDSLGTQLASSGSKIDQLDSERNAVVADLDTLIATLDENIAQIDEIQTGIQQIGNQLQNAEISSAEDIVNPILTQIKPILESKSYLDYTMPALLVLVIMFMSILLSSTIVITEKNTRAYFRNYIAPVPDVTFLISIYLTNIGIVFLQSLVLLVIAQFAFGVAILNSIASIIIALFIISSIFILIGMCIGYLFVSEETSTLASISFASICLLFSSFLIPIESLTPTIGTIAKLNPFVVSEAVLRQLVIFNNSIFAAGSDVLLLLFYMVILSVALYLSEMVDKRRLR
jgi:ABC-type multidrug transport system permease subunit